MSSDYKPAPKPPKGGSAVTTTISDHVQKQADREFLMNAWVAIAKQVIAHTLPSTNTNGETLVTLPTKVVEEMKARMKEGFFDV